MINKLISIAATITTLLYLTSPIIVSLGGWFIIGPVNFDERLKAFGLCSGILFGGAYIVYLTINSIKFVEEAPTND